MASAQVLFIEDSKLGKANAAPANHAERFRQIGRNHPLWNHELLNRCRNGRLTLTEVRTLGAQMYKFSREFSRYLAKALAV